MTLFVSLLRGVNVGGKRALKMRELEALYLSLGLEAVKSYLQSGNLVFRSSSDSGELAEQISQAIRQKFGLGVELLVLNASEFRHIARNNPFLSQADVDRSKLHVTFLAGKPDEARLPSIEGIGSGDDRFELKGKAVYLYCPGGYGRTKLNNTFFENKLRLKATTRNWNTVLALAEMAANS